MDLHVVGSSVVKYGGGHHQVGICRVLYDEADRVIAELIARIKIDS